MQVAGHGADDDLAQSAGSAGCQMGLQDLNALLHSLGGDQHFGHKDGAVLEVFANHVHGGDHGIQNLGGLNALVQGFLHSGGNQLCLAANDQIMYIFETHNNIPLL